MGHPRLVPIHRSPAAWPLFAAAFPPPGPVLYLAVPCPLRRAQGIATHITDVKPLVSVVAYTDPDSGYEIYQEVTGRTFMPLDKTAVGAGLLGARVRGRAWCVVVPL